MDRELQRETEELRRENVVLKKWLDRYMDLANEYHAGFMAEAVKQPVAPAKSTYTSAGVEIAHALLEGARVPSDIDAALGYSRGYTSRIMRGTLPLRKKAAVQIGSACGIDLSQYAEHSPRKRPNRQLNLTDGLRRLGIETGATITGGPPRASMVDLAYDLLAQGCAVHVSDTAGHTSPLRYEGVTE